MAVYEMNRRAIAAYLSDTKNEFVLGCVPSGEGKRVNKFGSSYPVKVVGLKGKEIEPRVDCFLNRDESITVRVYLPRFAFWAVTQELHKAYSPDERLSFGFAVEPKSFEYTLPKDKVDSYVDFKEPMDDLIQRISKELTKYINRFQTKEDWTITGIKIKTAFTVHSRSTK